MGIRKPLFDHKLRLRQPSGSSGTVTSVAGGVGITNTPEPITTTGTVDLDINSLTSETSLADGDLFPFVDVSSGTDPDDQRKVTFANIKAAIPRVTSVAGGVGITNSPEPITSTGTVDLDVNSLTTETTLADGDLFPFVDVSVGTTPSAQRKTTLDRLRVFTSVSDHLTAWRQLNSTTTTTFTAVGMPGIATTAAGGTTNVSDATGRWVRYDSSTTVNTNAGWTVQASLLDTQAQFKPDNTFIVRTGPASSDISAVRIWVGFFSGDPMASDTAGSGAGGNVMAFRYSTNAADTNWQSYTEDGADNNNVQDTGVVVAAATIYHLRIKVVTSSLIEFYINNVLVTSHITNLPSGTAGLGTIAAARNLTAGTTRRFDISRHNMIEATAA